MSTSADQQYMQKIIIEFNTLLSSWGKSDTWSLNQFNTLEEMIYEKTHVRINANTLKRIFFQQTSSPQMATRNALCVFLGYSSYSDFVLKNTKTEEINIEERVDQGSCNSVADSKIQNYHESPQPNKKTYYILKHKKTIITVFAFLCLVIFGLYQKGILLSLLPQKNFAEIQFIPSIIKGSSPLTVSFKYHIPKNILDSTYVLFKEPNGDIIKRHFASTDGITYTTFVKPGKCMAYLKYRNQLIKEIAIESRIPGWSAYIHDSKTDYFDTYTTENIVINNGYATLDINALPSKIKDAENLFTSYTFYKPNLIDGDDFSVEAKIRNSKIDRGIPCYDTMLYVFSDSSMHGFCINNEGFSYIKFLSGEKTLLGEKYNFSKIKFDPNMWHTMRIDVHKKKTDFYLDHVKVMSTHYNKNIGKANEVTLRFKGLGAVDYIRLFDANKKLVYMKDF